MLAALGNRGAYSSCHERKTSNRVGVYPWDGNTYSEWKSHHGIIDSYAKENFCEKIVDPKNNHDHNYIQIDFTNPYYKIVCLW